MGDQRTTGWLVTMKLDGVHTGKLDGKSLGRAWNKSGVGTGADSDKQYPYRIPPVQKECWKCRREKRVHCSGASHNIVWGACVPCTGA